MGAFDFLRKNINTILIVVLIGVLFGLSGGEDTHLEDYRTLLKTMEDSNRDFILHLQIQADSIRGEIDKVHQMNEYLIMDLQQQNNKLQKSLNKLNKIKYEKPTYNDFNDSTFIDVLKAVDGAEQGVHRPIPDISDRGL